MSSPAISVIMPAFMAQRWIARAIESVRGQTFRSWELLVVDDGSSDATAEVAAAYAGRDQRIRVIAQDNLGASAARNAAVAFARGAFVAYLDADDEFLPSHLEARLSALEGPADLVFGPVLADEGGRRYEFRGQLEGGDEDCVMPLMVMHRRVCFDVGLFDPGIVFEEDLDLWYRIAARYRIAALDGPATAIYHVRPDSVHRLYEAGGVDAVLAFREKHRRVQGGR